MAIFIPTLDKIQMFKVLPEEGEWTLLRFLEHNLDDSFEVYFNPYMNGDRPDIVIMRKNYGVLIIEVKDWNFDLYELDEKKNWVLKENKAVLKSPIQQVLKYKDNLYELHIDTLLEKKIKDYRNFTVVACAVYFHNANTKSIQNLIINPYCKDDNYQSFLKHNIDFIGQNNLNKNDFEKLLKKRYLISNKTSLFFTSDLYESFKRFLNPTIHTKEEGVYIKYSKKQLEIIYNNEKTQQRIKGVVGSGKTTVMVARAVQIFKRLSKNNVDPKILILTYNITLKNFIHDKLNKVPEKFSWSAFVITNYHEFINSQLNNLNIPIIIPPDISKEDINYYLEQNYYSNYSLFKKMESKIEKYDSILIDEIQDYKRPWMDIVKNCFLSNGGEYLLFGDVKQNIYNNQVDNKDIVTNIMGKPTELLRCFRSDFKVRDLAIEYQKNIFKDKYEIDNFNANIQSNEIQYERNQHGYIDYMFLPHSNSVSTLYTLIHENIINQSQTISPNDITILGYTINLLKKFEAYYRYMSNEKTKTMFETWEMTYKLGLDRCKKSPNQEWIVRGKELLKRDKDKKSDSAFQQLARLFTIYQLYSEYPDKFKSKLEFYCEKYKCTFEAFLKYIETYKNELVALEKQVNSGDYEFIRKYKKIHFWMNSGTIKIATINSFKGWESELIYLILEKNNAFNNSFDELIYTGITRSRSNLVIINFGNDEYDKKIKPLIEKVK